MGIRFQDKHLHTWIWDICFFALAPKFSLIFSLGFQDAQFLLGKFQVHDFALQASRPSGCVFAKLINNSWRENTAKLNLDGKLGIWGCVPFGESKNGFFDPRFARFRGRKEREIRNWICNLGNLSPTRAICTTASQKMTCFLLFDKLCDYTVQNLVVGSSNSNDGTYKTDKERSIKIENYLKNVGQFDPVP